MPPFRSKHFAKARIFLGLSFCALCFFFSSGASKAQVSQDPGDMPPPFTGLAAGGGDGAGQELRLQQLETELRTMTGKLEEQDYQIRQLKEQIERYMSDATLRFEDLEKNRAGAATATGASNAPPAPPVTIDSTPPAASGGYQWSSADSGAADGGQLGVLKTTSQSGASPTPVTDPAAAQYESAFAALKGGDYKTAEAGFQDFIKSRPKHPLVGNAKYWLGETYYARGDYKIAARIFAEGFQQYPKSSKAPDNLLKLGLSLENLGKKSDACVALGQIEKQYAQGAGPVLDRARQEMTRLGC